MKLKKCIGKNGPHYYDASKKRCPDCNRIWFRDYRINNPEKVRKIRRTSHLNNHEENKKKLRNYGSLNKEKKREYDKLYRDLNKEKIKDYKRIYSLKNPEKIKLTSKNHYENNKHMYTAYSAKRRASKRKATPEWSELDKIKLLYEKCKWLESLTGMKYHVDHIIPLNNKFVCGLHVWDNLQILEASLNINKSNYFEK